MSDGVDSASCGFANNPFLQKMGKKKPQTRTRASTVPSKPKPQPSKSKPSPSTTTKSSTPKSLTPKTQSKPKSSTPKSKSSKIAALTASLESKSVSYGSKQYKPKPKPFKSSNTYTSPTTTTSKEQTFDKPTGPTKRKKRTHKAIDVNIDDVEDKKDEIKPMISTTKSNDTSVHMTTNNSQIKTIQKQLENSKQLNNKLQKEMNILKSKITAKDNEIKQLTSTNNSNNKKLETMQNEMNKCKTLNKQLQQELDTLTAENKRKTNEIINLKKDISKKGNVSSSSDSKLKALENEIAVNKTLNKQLQSEIETLKNNNTKTVNENESLKNKIDELNQIICDKPTGPTKRKKSTHKAIDVNIDDIESSVVTEQKSEPEPVPVEVEEKGLFDEQVQEENPLLGPSTDETAWTDKVEEPKQVEVKEKEDSDGDVDVTLKKAVDVRVKPSGELIKEEVMEDIVVDPMEDAVDEKEKRVVNAKGLFDMDDGHEVNDNIWDDKPGIFDNDKKGKGKGVVKEKEKETVKRTNVDDVDDIFSKKKEGNVVKDKEKKTGFFGGMDDLTDIFGDDEEEDGDVDDIFGFNKERKNKGVKKKKKEKSIFDDDDDDDDLFAIEKEADDLAEKGKKDEEDTINID